MNKEKFIAATITTLVLFSIVRFFSPDVVDSPQALEEVDAVEDARLGEEHSKESEIIKFAPPMPVLKGEGDMPKVLKKKALDVKAGKLEDQFSVKSKFAYYKIKDGLALIGGDIVLGELSEDEKGSYENKIVKAEPPRSKLWPSSEIPYGFNEGFPEDLRGEVLKAVSYFNRETVMEFVEADTFVDEDVIVFKYRPGAPCSSYLGRVGGLQPIYLKNTCSEQDVLHEIMHALGFVHEQQREERDRVLEVLWPNIEEEFKYNFSMLPDSLVHQYAGSVFNVSLSSVMMYHDEAFAKEGLKSMKSLTNSKILPNNEGLSDIDKERLKLLYGS